MTYFQIYQSFLKSLDEGVDTSVAAKRCADQWAEHGYLLPIGHHGPLKADVRAIIEGREQ